MENNKKFDAQKLADELWVEIQAQSDRLKTDTAKRNHTNNFFKKHQLNQKQIQQVIANMSMQLDAEKEFNSLPIVLELYDLWTKKQFHYFFKEDTPNLMGLNANNFDFTRYFDEKKIPMWQRDPIIEHFSFYMSAKARENRSKILIPLVVCYGTALILAFFTPTIMQRFGVLAPEAGWGIKTINVIGSFIFFFLIARRVNSLWLDKVLLGK
jgi:hypothetical protein